jgi:hypothetical protein
MRPELLGCLSRQAQRSVDPQIEALEVVRSECLDWILIFNRRHLEQV